MRISGKKLTKVMKDKGASVETLASALIEPGKGLSNQSKAESALRNWMRGSDHPRCTADKINRLAEVLGVEAGQIARFTCVFKFHRGSPRKAALLTDLIRGKDYITASNLLTFTTKRAAVDVKKALQGAFADAEQAKADTNRLTVCESTVDKGPVIKRFHQKDRGRAHQILKRMSHIVVSLEEK
ncbi:MAG: 50S ribosomal protein L22 [Phycisphaerales bacterium]|nr:50S ribosomal protein L22 [Phycisphaerales bacterium]